MLNNFLINYLSNLEKECYISNNFDNL